MIGCQQLAEGSIPHSAAPAPQTRAVVSRREHGCIPHYIGEIPLMGRDTFLPPLRYSCLSQLVVSTHLRP